MRDRTNHTSQVLQNWNINLRQRNRLEDRNRRKRRVPFQNRVLAHEPNLPHLQDHEIIIMTENQELTIGLIDHTRILDALIETISPIAVSGNIKVGITIEMSTTRVITMENANIMIEAPLRDTSFEVKKSMNMMKKADVWRRGKLPQLSRAKIQCLRYRT